MQKTLLAHVPAGHGVKVDAFELFARDKPRREAGAAFARSSALYVLEIERSSGTVWYVGESDDLKRRLDEHCGTHRLADSLRVQCCLLPVENKSLAKEAETTLIRALQQLNVPLLNEAQR